MLNVQAVMDNNIFYGEYEIVGNAAVRADEFDAAPISFSTSISATDLSVTYLQYGLIYRELPTDVCKSLGIDFGQKFRNENNGFGLYFTELVGERVSDIEIYGENDLRNPKNQEIKNKIFAAFGLDGEAGYEKNLKTN